MNIAVKLTAVLLTLGVLAGCAGQSKQTTDTYILCSTAGAVVGGAGVGAVSSGVGAVGGAVAGAQLATMLCQTGDEPEPEMAKEAPVCEETPPAGALTDENGCAFDTDNDGVVDGVDLCRNTPEGVAVDRVGCPLQSDGDAVADYEDLCPNTPKGAIVDQDGCPIGGEMLLSLTGVNFGFDKATLTPEAQMILDEAVELLRDTDEMIEVRVEGHTDSIGTEQYNMQLSQERAEAVVQYLSDNGVNERLLKPVGMGEGFPVATNDTAAGRAENRRVDFVVNN